MYVKILLIASDRHKTRYGDKYPGSGTQTHRDSVFLFLLTPFFLLPQTNFLHEVEQITEGPTVYNTENSTQYSVIAYSVTLLNTL